jgi:hypothetical protein
MKNMSIDVENHAVKDGQHKSGIWHDFLLLKIKMFTIF